MNEEHYRKLEQMFLRANVNTSIYDSSTISISEGQAKIELNIVPKFFHALGAIHGSVYFKLLDDAAYFAVSSAVPDAFVLTTSFNINLIRPASKGRIHSVGKLKYSSRSHFLAEAVLFNEAGKEIAFGTGNFVKGKTPLTEDIGYKL